MRKITKEDVMFDKDLGFYFKCLRMDLGLSIKDLSSKSGLSTCVITALEDGRKRFTITLIRQFCKALEVASNPVELVRANVDYEGLEHVFNRFRKKKFLIELDKLVYELDADQIGFLVDYCKYLKGDCEDVI